MGHFPGTNPFEIVLIKGRNNPYFNLITQHVTNRKLHQSSDNDCFQTQTIFREKLLRMITFDIKSVLKNSKIK